MPRVVLVTGVGQSMGARAAQALRDDPGVDRVVGVDSTPPRTPLGAVEFVRADVCGGDIDRVIRESGADTVLHLGMLSASGGAEPGRECTLVDTMQVLAACQRAPNVGRLILRSSAAVDARVVEAEGYTRGLARRRPDLSITVLRFANVMGPSVESPLTRYLGMRVVPRMRGYDPTMRFLHEDDGVEVLRRMALGDGDAYDGFFDVAGPGAMPLSACLRRVGRPGISVPERGLRVLGGIGRRRGARYSPDRLRSLCSGRELDTRRLERALEWTPAYTSQQAFEAFASASERTSTRVEHSGPASPVGRVSPAVEAAVSR